MLAIALEHCPSELLSGGGPVAMWSGYFFFKFLAAKYIDAVIYGIGE